MVDSYSEFDSDELFSKEEEVLTYDQYKSQLEAGRRFNRVVPQTSDSSDDEVVGIKSKQPLTSSESYNRRGPLAY